MDLGLKIQKTNVGIRISILDNFDFFGPNLPENGFWGRNFKNLNPDSESAPPKYYVRQFSVKMDNFEIFRSKFVEIAQLCAIFWF